MTGSTRKPTTYLSLVKDKTHQHAGKFLSLEALPPEQGDIVQRYHKMIAPSAVLVGVIAGPLEWDLRPLMLNRGIMTIARVFSPQLLSSVTLSDAFKSYVFNIERLFPGVQGYSCGSGDGYSWITRRYFNHIISEQSLEISLQEKVKLLAGLLAEIEKLHSNSLVHGHICPSNIAYEDGKLILLDHGIQTHDPGVVHPGTTAPELRSSVAGQLNASPASDMYGLGLVTKRLLGNSLGTEYGNLVEVLLLSDPTLRPRLPQIVSHFVAEPTEQSSTPTTKNASSPKKSISTPEQQHTNVFLQRYLPIGLLLGLGLYLFGGKLVDTIGFGSKSSPEIAEKLEKYWDSGQTSLMQQVVGAALSGNRNALAFIFDRISSNFSHPAVQMSLYKAALNPAWEDELSENDKIVLLKLGMPSLVPPEYRDMPNFASLHPGVILSVVGHMGVEAGMRSLEGVSLGKFGSLELPYGAAFSALEKIGVSNLSDPSAQALCHIFSGDTSPTILRDFVYSNGDVQSAFAKLEVLVPLFDTIVGLDGEVLKGLSLIEEGNAQVLTWFAKDLVAEWSKVSPRTKLLLFTGVFPSEQLTFEQYADLLRFPRMQIRERAQEKLLQSSSPEVHAVLSYLASKDSALTRTQTISLLAALMVKSDAAHSFVSQWFDTEPEPKSVLQVLLLHTQPQGLDPFNLEAARYLIDKEFDLSLDEIHRLAQNPEPLARTLAYARLKVDMPEHRALLGQFAQQETSAKIREQLLLRLSDGGFDN